MQSRTALFFLAGLAGVLPLAGCDEFDTEVRVEYRVESDASRVRLVYRTEFGQDVLRVETPPFRYEGDFQKGVLIGIQAQSLDAEPRSVTCELLVEGEPLDTDSAAGQAAGVVCTAVADD